VPIEILDNMCRTRFGSNCNNENIGHSRGNIAPVTINLVKPALEIRKRFLNEDVDNEYKYELYENEIINMITMCKDQLLYRYEVLKKLKCKDLPFITSQHLIMGSENLGPDDSIEEILKNGTFGIGFIGVAEAMTALFGKHHGETKEIWNYAYKIIELIRKAADTYTELYKLNFSCYASPAEGLSGRFTAIDKEVYGEIKGITDKGYYSNSNHIPVEFNISAADKIRLEAPFHELCNGGHISYIELDRPPVDNPEIVERLINFAFNESNNAGYVGINFGVRYCKVCGAQHIKGNQCPICRSTDIQGIFRTTGYLSLDERSGPGKTAEKIARTKHFFKRDDL
jgi:ribonucleoside-triphosphate reductase (formate)